MSKEKTLAEINRERIAMLDRAEDQEHMELAEARSLFDVDEVLSDATKPRKLLLTELGDNSFHVYWCPLNSVDRISVLRITDDNAEVQTDLRNRHAVYLMLNKAEPKCTEQLVKQMPAHWIDLILTKIAAEQNSFLSPLVRSVLSGLKPASTRRRKA